MNIISTNYRIFTEIKTKDSPDWLCINPRLPKLNKRDELEVADTIWSGSRSYFGRTADELVEMGYRVEYADLSDTLQKEYKPYHNAPKDAFYDYYNTFYGINFNDIKDRIPNPQLKQNHGWVNKDDIFSYEVENGEIWEYLNYEEFKALDDEEKKQYQYYEWDDTQGWYYHFQRIINKVNQQMIDMDSVNSFNANNIEIRLILKIS